MTSLEIREFSESIKNYVNKSALPLEVKRMVLEEITREVSVQTVERLKAELNERDNKGKTVNEAGEETDDAKDAQ